MDDVPKNSNNNAPNYLPIIGLTDIRTLLEKRYDIGKKVCFHIYDNPKDIQSFEDLYHNTIYNALKCLGPKKMDQDEMILYFMRAFRNNLIRQYKYSYHKKCKDIDLSKMIIPIDNENEINAHIDGWEMIDMVRHVFGEELANALLDQMNGFTYETISKRHDFNAFYELNKVKNYLKTYYCKDAYCFDKESGLWLKNNEIVGDSYSFR